MRGFRFLEMRGGCGWLRVYGLPILFYFLRSTTRPLAREEERLAHIAEPAGGRSEAGGRRESSRIKKEKRTARAVCMAGGGYFAPHDTNNNLGFGFYFYFGFLFTYAVPEHLRAVHHLPDGRFASRGALAELFLFIPRPHSF
jgi:hypothetical protein